MGCEHYLTGLPQGDIDQILDNSAGSDRMQTVLDLLNQNESVVRCLLNFRHDPHDASFTSTEVELGVLSPLAVTDSKHRRLAPGGKAQTIASLHVFAEDPLDCSDNLVRQCDYLCGNEHVADRFYQLSPFRGRDRSRYTKVVDRPSERLTIPFELREARCPLKRQARIGFLVDDLVLDRPILHAGVVGTALGEKRTWGDVLICQAGSS